MTEPRTCWWVPFGQRDRYGYMPSLVTEGQAGHVPCTGNADGGPPQYWGQTFEEAHARCEKENEARGISPEAAREIVRSCRPQVPGSAG